MRKIISLILFAVLALSVTLAISSCGTDAFYDNAEKYTAGSVELQASINALDIEWISGEVKISYHDSDEIHCTESANRELKSNERVHWFVDNGTLKVRFSESGRWNFKSLEKTLEIKLPNEMKLTAAKIETVSANISSNGLYTSELAVESVSGDITLTNLSVKSAFELDTVSGNTSVSLITELDTLEAESTSGNIEIAAKRIQFASLENTSGNIRLNLSETGRTLDIESVSGHVTLDLPSPSSFKLKLDTVSGSFSSDIQTTTSLGYYVSGSGEYKIKIETTSGNVKINKK